MNNKPFEVVEIAQPRNQEENNSWQPIVGRETLDLLDYINLPDGEKDLVKNEAVSTLSKCTSPHAPSGMTTGLVVGYVQSGKTMSFTTVTALARDNGFQIVIIITGTSNPLLNQSTRRLQNDLRLLTKRDRKWQHFESRTLEKSHHINIKNTLKNWLDPHVPQSEKTTILITVMKQHQHLKKISEMLSEVGSLEGVPTLIIDDEADQASLNTKVKKGEISTTYQRILSLKKLLPHHSFLQYTATPQAPLLINLIDILSPDFVEVLTPGKKYVGGKEFFLESPNLIKIIPDSEIPRKNTSFDAPPASLLYAMQLFFLGVVAGIILENSVGNRSMMVHPSRKTVGHKKYFQWIGQVIKRWQKTFDADKRDLYRLELLDDFKFAYNQLNKTVKNLPSFNEMSKKLPYAIRSTNLEEINASKGKTPTVNWRNSYAHILVGGQAMDRGFTVEGLTITYMPRGGGVRNADTIQQRARFLGYKKAYKNYCRVFLENQVRDSYYHYVAHEEDIRERLIAHNALGEPLTTWKRAFFLTRSLKPTRRNVLGLDYMRGSFKKQWYTPKAPHDSSDAVHENKIIYEKFLSQLSFTEDKRYSGQKHKKAKSSLDFAYEQLLVPFRVTRLIDSQKYTGLLLQLKAYIEQYPKTNCTIYLMSGGAPRKRNTNDKDEIKQLFQGKNPKKGKIIYPGDRAIKKNEEVTIQLHNLTIESQGKEHTGIPAIAIWVPGNMPNDWLVQ